MDNKSCPEAGSWKTECSSGLFEAEREGGLAKFWNFYDSLINYFIIGPWESKSYCVVKKYQNLTTI